MYATPIVQPTTPVAHLTTGLAIYAYLPMNPSRLPEPSPADLLFFTDASGEPVLTPITGGATLQLTHRRGTLPHGPTHGPHHLLVLLPRGTGGHGRRHRPNRYPPTRPPPVRRPGLVRSGRHYQHTPTPPHSKTTTPQSHRNEPQDTSTATLESPLQAFPPTSNFAS